MLDLYPCSYELEREFCTEIDLHKVVLGSVDNLISDLGENPNMRRKTIFQPAAEVPPGRGCLSDPFQTSHSRHKAPESATLTEKTSFS